MVQDEAAPATTCKQRLGYQGCRSGGSCLELGLGQLSRGAKGSHMYGCVGPSACGVCNIQRAL